MDNDRMISSVALTCRKDLRDKEEVLSRILKVIRETDIRLCIDAQCCDMEELRDCERCNDLANVDLVIVVGGDGTILSSVRRLKDRSIPLLCIHHGTLGFLAEFDSEDIEKKLRRYLDGNGILDERQLLTVEIEEHGNRTHAGDVLNEAVIGQGGIARLIELQTHVGGKHFTTFRADGLILGTPTGSTAYNLAAGGSIIHPHLTHDAILLTPINPQNFNHKPIVIPGDREVCVEVMAKDNPYRTTDHVLTLDGQVTLPLHRGQRVCVRSTQERIRFLRHEEDTFFTKLKEVLGWGEKSK